MSTAHPMVEKAARAWCKRHAEACGLDEATLWAEREAGFITEAQAALEACGALELLEALRAADRCLSTPHSKRNKPDGTGENTNLAVIRAAIAKAEGQS